MKTRQLSLYVFLGIIFPLFSQKLDLSIIKEGDILFQRLDCGDLCRSIHKVTKGIYGEHFSHCGLVVRHEDSLKIIEAIGNNVHYTSIDNFVKRKANPSHIFIGRLKPEFESISKRVSDLSSEYLGMPYDEVFLPNNGKIYCSELIYEVFEKANEGRAFFDLKPLTFKNPKTKRFFKPWVKYYKDLKTEIPEAVLGINPGAISLSNQLMIFKL